jgi:hypothetical protein
MTKTPLQRIEEFLERDDYLPSHAHIDISKTLKTISVLKAALREASSLLYNYTVGAMNNDDELRSVANILDGDEK